MKKLAEGYRLPHSDEFKRRAAGVFTIKAEDLGLVRDAFVPEDRVD